MPDAEEKEQQDDDSRHSEQPQQNEAHYTVLLMKVSPSAGARWAAANWSRLR